MKRIKCCQALIRFNIEEEERKSLSLSIFLPGKDIKHTELGQKGSSHLSKSGQSPHFTLRSHLLLALFYLLAKKFWEPLSFTKISFFWSSTFSAIIKGRGQISTLFYLPLNPSKSR